MPAGNLYSPLLDSRDLIADFYPRLEATLETLWFPQISLEIPSDRGTEELGWLGQVRGPRKWIGNRQADVLNKYTHTITNEKYEWTLPISNDDIRRDKTAQIRTRIGEGAVRFATHWNSLGGQLIAGGDGSTYGLAYDGQYFYDTDHNESGTNQLNSLGSSEVPSSNVTTPATPTVTEAANVATETISYMMGLIDDKGEPINQSATSVLILCTKQGHYNAFRQAIGLNNLGTGSGNNNPLLAWNSDYQFAVRYVPTRVTAADKIYFFFGTPTMGSAAFIRTEELGVQTTMKDMTHDNDGMEFGAHANRGVAFGQWQKSAMVTLT